MNKDEFVKKLRIRNSVELENVKAAVELMLNKQVEILDSSSRSFKWTPPDGVNLEMAAANLRERGFSALIDYGEDRPGMYCEPSIKVNW